MCCIRKTDFNLLHPDVYTQTHKVNNCRCDVISIPMAPVIVNGGRFLCLSHKSVLLSLACNTDHKQSQCISVCRGVVMSDYEPDYVKPVSDCMIWV